MKVLHIIDSGGLYGAEVVLLNLVEEQLKMALLPMIASIGIPGIIEKPLETEARRRQLPVEKIRFKPGPNFKGAREITKFAQENQYTILHSHGYKGNILLGFLPRKIRRVPLVATLHGWTSTSGLTKMRVYEWLDSISLRYIDQVVVVNREMLKQPRMPKSVQNVVVIDNGIPLRDDKETTLDETIVHFCRQKPTLCAIGRLSPEKGFDILIEALNRISETHGDIQLLLIGEGGQREKLSGLARQYQLEDRVCMPGYRDQAHRYMNLCRCLVMPSLTEGLPITLLEAMRARIPVVAAAVGGIPEVLDYGRCGVLVSQHSAEAFAGGIEQILENPSIVAKLTSSALNRFEDTYSSRKMAKAYLEVYLQLKNQDLLMAANQAL